MRAKVCFNCPIFWVGMETDYDQAEAALEDYRTLTRRRYGLQRFHPQTRDLVLGAWPAIDALARALTDAGLLEFEEAHRIIAPLLPDLFVQKGADAP